MILHPKARGSLAADPRGSAGPAPARTRGALLLALCLCLPLSLAAQAPEAEKQPFDEASWSLFQKVFSLVLRDYVDSKKPDQVILGALQGAAESAGPECAYVPPAEVEAYKALSKPGPTLPLYVTKYGDFARVLAAFPGQDPAIRPGDPLRFIGTASTYDLTYPKVLQALRGKDGEAVKCLFLKQDAWQSYEATLTRRMPASPRVIPLGGDGVALALPCLEAEPSAALAAELKAASGPVLVDLRGCASPDAGAARRWAGELLGPREGPSVKGSRGTRRLALTGPGLLSGRPFMVLVDQSTARGGEVLAVALQGAGGVLVGAPTYGNAPMIEDIPLENGGLLRLATAYLLGPDGEMVKEKPIAPAVALDFPAGEKPEETCRRALKAPAPPLKVEAEKPQPDPRAKAPEPGDAGKKK
jgi:C-terminal processing protease CtpA/Prc